MPICLECNSETEKLFKDMCRRCYMRQYMRTWRRKHPEKVSGHNKISRQRHLEKRRAHDREYYRKHREKRLAYIHGYNKHNREHINARNRAYYRKCTETIKVQKAQYRREHAAEILDYLRANYEHRKATAADWRHRHPEKNAEYVARRRARKISASGIHTASEWRSLKEQYGHRCFYCGKPSQRLTRDHLVPLSRGGDDDIINIVPACRSCNSRKGPRTIEEFAEYLASLSSPNS